MSDIQLAPNERLVEPRFDPTGNIYNFVKINQGSNGLPRTPPGLLFIQPPPPPRPIGLMGAKVIWINTAEFVDLA